MSNLLTALRDVTGVAHQALHVHPLLAPLQVSNITLDDYHWCLQGFHQAHCQLEQALRYTGPIEAVPALAWLEKDLHINALAPKELSRVTYPPIDSYSKYLGYLYVTQGATLGGRVISKHLHQTLGLIEQETNHFFAGFGAETGARWKLFLSLLDDSAVLHVEVIDQAIQTFYLIASCCDDMLAAKQAAAHSACCG